ncbi:MAG: hypothetical protein JWQ72_3150 [Polaromonas sp.]|nr:hypothetical protein [Polaromonas sp.]
MTPIKPGTGTQTATSAAQAKAVLRKKDSADEATFSSQTGHDAASQPSTRDTTGEASAMNIGQAGVSYQYAQDSVPAADPSTGASTSASTSPAASPAATTPTAAPVFVNDMFNPWLTGGAVLAGAPAPAPTTATATATAATAVTAAPAPAPAPAIPDTVAPTLAITSNMAALKAGETATVTFTFSEAPVGFVAGDISVAGGTLGVPLASTTDSRVYTATFTPTAGVDAATGLITVASGLYADAAGNSGGAGTMPALAIDTLAPATPVIMTDSSTGSIINGMGQFFDFFGAIPTGDTVELTIGGIPYAPTHQPTFFDPTRTVWFYTLTAADVAAMDQGALTVTATQTDAAGNSSAAVPLHFMVDTIAPVFTSVGANVNVAENTAVGTPVFDATANGDVGVRYELSGGMDAFEFSINAATGQVYLGANPALGQLATRPNFEFAVDVGADHVYEFGINATDAAGNVTTQAVKVTVTDVLETNQAGDAIIDLGMYGYLINPVQVEGKWYYFWDRNGSGSASAANNSSTRYGGYDFMNHNVLDGLFNHDINGVLNTTEINPGDGNFGTTNNFRYATINGVKLALPTAGGVIGPNGSATNYPGTAISDGTSNNPTYDDLMAIWDAYNGSGTGSALTSGVPAGWMTGLWSASLGTSLNHAVVGMNVGTINSVADTVDAFVVLQVL